MAMMALPQPSSPSRLAAAHPRCIAPLCAPQIVQPPGDAADLIFPESPNAFGGCSPASSVNKFFPAPANLSQSQGDASENSRNYEYCIAGASKTRKLFKAAVHSILAARGLQLDPSRKRCYDKDRVVNPKDIEQIDKDLPRTGQGDPLVRCHMGRIRAILLRHVAEDPDLGYCQGMSLAAAAFAAASRSQAEAFQRYSSFIKRVRGLFLPGFPMYFRARDLFTSIVQSRPWYAHMMARDVDPDSYLPQALMTLLTKWLPMATVVELLKQTLLEQNGLAGLLAASIAVLDLVSPQIQRLEKMEEILEFLKDLNQHAPQRDNVVIKISEILPDIVVQRARLERMSVQRSGSVRVFRKRSPKMVNVATEDGESLFPSISQALTCALEETEAAGQWALKWAEEETSAMGDALFPWSLTKMSASFSDIVAPTVRTAPRSAKRSIVAI